jgi:hypothetical protein
MCGKNMENLDIDLSFLEDDATDVKKDSSNIIMFSFL